MTGDFVPWITHRAFKFLKGIVHPRMRVFEWGAGNSTIYFAQHVHEITSIEHDEVWAEKIQKEVVKQNLPTFHDVRLVPGEIGRIEDHPDPNHPINYFQPDQKGKFDELNFKNYVEQIEAWSSLYFDLIFVDGVARASCLEHGVSRLKFGGWLVLDNSDRLEETRHVRHIFQCWEPHVFFGHGPINPYRWETTIWRKPK